MDIPVPPEQLREPYPSLFIPEPKMPEFLKDTFLDAESKLFNEDHHHLMDATFGVLWTNVTNEYKGNRVLASVEEGQPKGKSWGREKKEQQIEEWFGDFPDFIITIDSLEWMEFTNNQRCAILEHELYHCAQKKDEFGMPKFSKATGQPLFGIVGHDIEEFIGVVKRYGAYSDGLKQFNKAMNNAPKIPIDTIEGICGNCMKKVA